MTPCTLTPEQVQSAYLSNWPKSSGPFCAALLTWPDMFRASLNHGPTIEELLAALNALRIEGAEPAFGDVRETILRRRQAANIARHETNQPSRDCNACKGDGYVTVLVTAKPGGHGRRVLNFNRAEAIPARDIYPVPVPCVCAEGDRVNADQLLGCRGGDVAPVKAYCLTREHRDRLCRCRVTPEEVPVYREACETLYRQAHGLQPLEVLRPAPDTGNAFAAMVARVVERARGAAQYQPPSTKPSMKTEEHWQ